MEYLRSFHEFIMSQVLDWVRSLSKSEQNWAMQCSAERRPVVRFNSPSLFQYFKHYS